MAGRHDRRQVHEAGAALDGVKGTKHRVQDVVTVRLQLERQQMVFNLRRQVQGLDDEVLQHVVLHQNPSSPSKLSTSVCIIEAVGTLGPDNRSTSALRVIIGA